MRPCCCPTWHRRRTLRNCRSLRRWRSTTRSPHSSPELRARLSLKWPNDVLCDGNKICGILLEGESAATWRRDGGGRNRRQLRASSARHGISRHRSSGIGLRRVARQRVSVAVGAMVRRLDQWQRGAGFAAIRADWLTRAAGLGQTIRVRLHDREMTGVFEALDERGHLVVAPRGRRARNDCCRRCISHPRHAGGARLMAGCARRTRIRAAGRRRRDRHEPRALRAWVATAQDLDGGRFRRFVCRRRSAGRRPDHARHRFSGGATQEPGRDCPDPRPRRSFRRACSIFGRASRCRSTPRRLPQR